MTTEEAQQLIPLYALGALDATETRDLEGYLRQAPRATQREADEFREIAALLAYGLPAVAVPARLREQLLARVNESAAPAVIAPVSANAAPIAKVLAFKPKAVAAAPRAWTQWLAAAAALVMTAGTAFFYWQNQQLKQENLALAQQVVAVKAEQQAQIEQVLAPLNRILTIKGQAAAPQASAKVVWDTQQQRWLLQVYDLPAPPADKDYQLWYVTKDAKLSAAVFRPDARGRTTLRLQLPANVNAETLAATAVTLEPKGGVPQPTGQFYLLAQL